MKVAIGLILTHGFPVPTAFIKGIFDWYGTTISGAGNALLPPERQITGAQLIYSEDFPIDAARNDICRTFLDKTDAEFEYLIFLDADMRHPADVIHRLVQTGLPIVSGRYQMRKAPFKTVAMRKTGDGPRDYDSITEESGIVPIDAAGAGVLAIRRDVLEAMRREFGEEWFFYQVGPNGLRSVSEDMGFFERAKACHFQAVCDLDIVCTHVTAFEVEPSWHRPWKARHDEIVQVQVPA